ncbi:MAG: TIGR03960 family B12-binding radical SAM protein [Eggerthellaceae bacterium]|nr:TIGR03960 family B12-binding radical SAM protein [Eggerthellaceae bacterium]
MARTCIWDDIAPLLRSVERPGRYVGAEIGSHVPDPDAFGFCMIYPDTYELGQANQAVRILVNRAQQVPGVSAERAYMPGADMADALRAHGLPMFSLEGTSPLHEFDCIGITLPHELCATNIYEILDLGRIPITWDVREEDDPIVIGGGPCAFNPEPFSRAFDAILIGEGEESVPQVLSLIRDMRASGAPRADILRALSQVEGTYVPALYELQDGALTPMSGAPERVEKRVFEGFADSSGWEDMVVPFVECVHDRLNVEVLRGCSRGCRFCQAGMIYRPVRERSAENIVQSVMEGIEGTGYEEVSLTSLSTTDHSQIAQILQDLNARLEGSGVRISVPSQRLDSFGVEMADAVAGQRRGGLTFAPEAGSQRLRDVINKNVTEEDLMSAVRAAVNAGWQRVKLYFMIGLPTETDEDVAEIGRLATEAFRIMRELTPPEDRGRLKMTVALAVFVPKAHTPFQWEGQIPPEEARRRAQIVREATRFRAIKVDYHEPKTSLLEAVMSRGGRDVALLVEEAWKRGARFDAWTEHFSQEAWDEAASALGVDMAALAHDPLDVDGPLPWDHVSSGVTKRFLALERKRALAGITTEDCTFGACSACGVCSPSGPAICLQEERAHE